MKLRFQAKARDDLNSTLGCIRERNPLAADDLEERVFAAAERLAAGDFDGPEERLTSGNLVRSWPVPPFRLYYQRRGTTLWILRVYHHARKPIDPSIARRRRR